MATGPLSVPVTFGTSRTRGLFDDDTQTVDDGNGAFVSQTVRTLTGPTATLSTLDEGDTVTIDGDDYVVRAKHARDDGHLMQFLVVPSP